MSKLTPMEEAAIMKELEAFDTPTVSNVVATFPGKKTCLGLYDAWEDNWYTDERMKLMYPQMGRSCGYAVTCTYGIADGSKGPTVGDILDVIGDSPKPVVLVVKQDVPEKYRMKFGLLGGNMAQAFKSAGCCALISDGPSRDLEEVEEIGIQYMLTGLSAAHGPMAVKAVNTPVTVCSMDVNPGEIIHLDVNGAIKFPREYLAEVLEKCRELSETEDKKKKMLASTSDVKLLTKYMKGVYD